MIYAECFEILLFTPDAMSGVKTSDIPKLDGLYPLLSAKLHVQCCPSRAYVPI
jgi:hypothetical protein